MTPSRRREDEPDLPLVVGNPYYARREALRVVRAMQADVNAILAKPTNKYGARRTWSELCQRTFASKAEAIRGEELAMLEKAGEISGLCYQPRWVLSTEPKITYTADFEYLDKDGEYMVEDAKGMDTRDSRTKRAWIREKYGIEVKVVKGETQHG